MDPFDQYSDAEVENAISKVMDGYSADAPITARSAAAATAAAAMEDDSEVPQPGEELAGEDSELPRHHQKRVITGEMSVAKDGGTNDKRLNKSLLHRLSLLYPFFDNNSRCS